MIAVLGGSGYIARAFVRELIRRNEVFSVLSRRDVDYTDPHRLHDYLKKARPALLINAAGYTGKPNVDACEVNRSECYAGNVTLPQNIGEVCAVLSVPWGHVSSGCIFQGDNDGAGFTEADPPNFNFDSESFGDGRCSYYSGTKDLGERKITNLDCYVWRLRIPFDEQDHSRNYLSKLQMYERLYNARNSLSHRGQFVKACLDLWGLSAPFGTYNLTNPGSVTTAEVVDLMREGGLLDRVKWFDGDADFYKVAKTPRSNCVLDHSKAIAAGANLQSVRDALADSIKKWRFC